MESANGERIAFVLSGGGNLGAVQVGMLQALLERGIEPGAVVGSSIGALNGAFLAGHADRAGIEELADLWMSVRRQEVFPLHPRSLVRGVLGHRPYLFDGFGVRSLLMRADLGFDRIEEAAVPLRLVATELRTGEPVVLSRGRLVPALMASSAIPGVFPPVEVDGRTLVDGGVVANTPIAQAELLDPTLIYVLPTVPDRLSDPPSNAVAMMQRAMVLAGRTAERMALADVAARRTVRVLPVPDLASRLSIFDFGATGQLMDESYRLAAAWLEDTDAPAPTGVAVSATSNL
jgi:NTE family protein